MTYSELKKLLNELPENEMDKEILFLCEDHNDVVFLSASLLSKIERKNFKSDLKRYKKIEDVPLLLIFGLED